MTIAIPHQDTCRPGVPTSPAKRTAPDAGAPPAASIVSRMSTAKATTAAMVTPAYVIT